VSAVTRIVARLTAGMLEARRAEQRIVEAQRNTFATDAELAELTCMSVESMRTESASTESPRGARQRRDYDGRIPRGYPLDATGVPSSVRS